MSNSVNSYIETAWINLAEKLWIVFNKCDMTCITLYTENQLKTWRCLQSNKHLGTHIVKCKQTHLT